MIHQPIFRQHNSDTDFYRQWTCLWGLTMDFELDEAQYIHLTGHMDVHHRGLVDGVVGYAGSLSHEELTAPLVVPQVLLPWSCVPGTRILGSVNGGNVLNETAHYGKIVWNGLVLLQPGCHRIMAHANSHSSIDNNSRDGLIEALVEGGYGLNCLHATFHKGPCE